MLFIKRGMKLWKRSRPVGGTASNSKPMRLKLALRSDKAIVEIAGDLGIRAELLYRWKAEYQAKQESSFPESGHLKDPEVEVLGDVVE